jgi:hypothetical protein
MKVMKAKEIKENIYEKLISLNYHRKENFISEVDESVDFNDFDKETQKVICTFPTHIFKPKNDLMDIELDGKQQFFIFQSTDGEDYLVDTQGYNYPRYIIKLENLKYSNNEDDPFEMMESLVRINDSKMFDLVAKSLAFELQQEGFVREDILNYLELKLAKAFGSAE